MDDPATQAANRVFDLEHICRIDTWPDFLLRSTENMVVSDCFPTEWDIQEWLHEIKAAG